MDIEGNGNVTESQNLPSYLFLKAYTVKINFHFCFAFMCMSF